MHLPKVMIFFAFALCAGLLVNPGRAENLVPEKAFFLSGQVLRRACVYKPEGKGPFPAMIYNQATVKPSIETGDPTPFLELAKLYTRRGYIFFLPGRRIFEGFNSETNNSTTNQNQRFIDAMNLHTPDFEAAIAWLKSQSYVDEKRIVISGHSTGAIQSLLLAQNNLGIRGIVAFSPGAKIWRENPLLQDVMLDGIKNSKVPIFLIQAQNDFSLGPNQTLAPELARKGKPNFSKVYLPFGRTPVEGNSFAFAAPEIWSDDVFNFLDQVMK